MSKLSLSFSMFLISLLVGCGLQSELSSLQSGSKQECADVAHGKRDGAYVEASKAFEANSSACYELLDMKRFSSVTLCLKGSDASRKQDLLNADLVLAAALSACENAQ